MAKILPLVRIGGDLFFRDDRLEEYRYVNDSNDRLLFRDVAALLKLSECLKSRARSQFKNIGEEELRGFDIDMEELELRNADKIELLRRESEKCLKKKQPWST